MIAFGHLVFLTAALWQCVRTEHDCEPVQATSSALLQSAPQVSCVSQNFSKESNRINARTHSWAGPGAKSVTWRSSFWDCITVDDSFVSFRGPQDAPFQRDDTVPVPRVAWSIQGSLLWNCSILQAESCVVAYDSTVHEWLPNKDE